MTGPHKAVALIQAAAVTCIVVIPAVPVWAEYERARSMQIEIS